MIIIMYRNILIVSYYILLLLHYISLLDWMFADQFTKGSTILQGILVSLSTEKKWRAKWRSFQMLSLTIKTI